jgi:hypothetical protein
MCSLVLDIEQEKSLSIQALNQVKERQLTGVWLPAKHAFSRKEPTQTDPIESSNQLAIQPGFYAVCESKFVKS